MWKELWRVIKKYHDKRELILPAYLDIPVAVYINCPPAVCSKCTGQYRDYTQFPLERIICTNCHSTT